MRKHIGFWAGLTLTLASGLSVAAKDAATIDTIVATVNGENITLGELIVLREKLPPQYQQLPDDMLFKGLIDQAVQQLILEQSIAKTKSKHDELWLKTDARDYMANRALEDIVKSTITDEALQAAYNEQYAKAPDTTEYSAAHILVADEAKAKDLKAQIDGGADFAELAKTNSTDTSSAVNGGDLGWFGTGVMVKPFEEAVVSLKPGAISAPVKTDFGWHIIKLNKTRIATKPTLDQVKQDLTAEIKEKIVSKHIEKLTNEAKIEKPGEELDAAIIRNTTLFIK